jgi:hypothetical protein
MQGIRKERTGRQRKERKRNRWLTRMQTQTTRLSVHARQPSVRVVCVCMRVSHLFLLCSFLLRPVHSLRIPCISKICPSPPLRVLCKTFEFLPCITPLHTAHLFSLALVSILCLFSLALLSDMHKCAYITVILFHRRYKQSLALPETKEADITL